MGGVQNRVGRTILPNRLRISFWGNKDVCNWERVVVAQLSECTKPPELHFRVVSFM
jgi:hypothetical protein